MRLGSSCAPYCSDATRGATHSARIATAGSTLVARRAGNRLAIRATATRAIGTSMQVTASVGATP